MKSETRKKSLQAAPRIEKERSEFKNLLVKNLNYFGTFPEVKIKAVKPMSLNTKYEELRCVGFYPEEDLLEAVIDIKQPIGYKGTLCSAGSYEYVRFFVDWGTGFEDVGIGSVNVHDIPNGDYACVEEAKPLSYAVTLRLNPKKRPCISPNLVKVRAILSWDIAPPAGNPGYQPIWGNVVNKWIQIKPGPLLVKDIIEIANLKKLGLAPAMLNLDSAISEEKPLGTAELKELYKGKDVPEHRYDFVHIHQIAEKIKQEPVLMAPYQINPNLKKSLKPVEAILVENLNTKYEQLDCVGLNYDLDTLVATLTLKRSSGYSGGLCTAGSYEYVAFWIFELDPIEGVCIWKYLGTAKVNVHDVKNTEGLQYAVYLKHDFSAYKDKCSKPKVFVVRAILSWEAPPPTDNAGYNPVWGNSVDAVIQLKPPRLPSVPTDQVPIIISIGDMSLEKISGNVPSGYTSPLGVGYAKGPASVAGFEANDSPFGDRITVCGYVSNAPSAGPKLKYKVRKWIRGMWEDITDPFWITLEKNGSFVPKLQEAHNGYFEYENGYDGWKVLDDVLAKWQSKKKLSDNTNGDGLTYIKVELEATGASDHAWIVVDNTEPEADITIDFTSDAPYLDDQTAPTAEKKPCGKVTAGKYIIGRFKAKDTLVCEGREHYLTFYIHVYPDLVQGIPTPQNFSHEPKEAVKSYPNVPTEGIPMPPPPSATLPHYATPLPNGVWQLNTTGMLPCGYAVILTVYDRTIVESGYIGRWKTASVGFCLE